jgi:hypothetical protein
MSISLRYREAYRRLSAALHVKLERAAASRDCTQGMVRFMRSPLYNRLQRLAFLGARRIDVRHDMAMEPRPY